MIKLDGKEDKEKDEKKLGSSDMAKKLSELESEQHYIRKKVVKAFDKRDERIAKIENLDLNLLEKMEESEESRQRVLNTQFSTNISKLDVKIRRENLTLYDDFRKRAIYLEKEIVRIRGVIQSLIGMEIKHYGDMVSQLRAFDPNDHQLKGLEMRLIDWEGLRSLIPEENVCVVCLYSTDKTNAFYTTDILSRFVCKSCQDAIITTNEMKIDDLKTLEKGEINDKPCGECQNLSDEIEYYFDDLPHKCHKRSNDKGIEVSRNKDYIDANCKHFEPKWKKCPACGSRMEVSTNGFISDAWYCLNGECSYTESIDGTHSIEIETNQILNNKKDHEVE